MEKTYVTFGQEHIHLINNKTFDKDCVAVIHCNDMKQGREIAVNTFGTDFFTTYHEGAFNQKDMVFFPKGFVEVNSSTKSPELFKQLFNYTDETVSCSNCIHANLEKKIGLHCTAGDFQVNINGYCTNHIKN